MTEGQCLLAVSLAPLLGPTRIKLLFSYFGSAKAIWEASQSDLFKVGLGEKIVLSFEKHRKTFDPKSYFEKLKKENVTFIGFNESSYPANLRELEGAPIVLYVKGNIQALSGPCCAVVGSRKMTRYGKEVTQKISFELAKAGITVISGLARGVDTEAHKAALLAGGRTVAVMGCGLDKMYPPENLQLSREIIEKGGAVTSEYPLGFPIAASNFTARNRIISGLSKAVVVVEGAAKSGTLLTASAAAEQGRTVFAVPGPINSSLSAAPLFLLQNGARIYTNTREVIEEVSD